MQANRGRPQPSLPGAPALIAAASALGGLFFSFFIYSFVRHLNLQAKAFTGLGTVWAMGFAFAQWRHMRRWATRHRR